MKYLQIMMDYRKQIVTRHIINLFLRLAIVYLHLWNVQSAIVINTWPFTNATSTAIKELQKNEKAKAIDAIAVGCNQCEVEQCDYTVGYGGSPDSIGETTLDAMILDGTTHGMGAVADLRRVKHAILVAKAVMEHSAHSILAGEGAVEFAKMMGFQEESLETPRSKDQYLAWKKKLCQPNYYRHVKNQNSSCPPYTPLVIDKYAKPESTILQQQEWEVSENLITTTNHDTIGMIVLDNTGNMAAGTSSNGAIHKIAGRVGDAAIPGAGAYVDSTIGGAAATGDGDIMMRFLPTFHAVQDMQLGYHPNEACRRALGRIASIYPMFKGGMVCLNRMGEYGGAGHGWNFSYSIQTTDMKDPKVIIVQPISLQ